MRKTKNKKNKFKSKQNKFRNQKIRKSNQHHKLDKKIRFDKFKNVLKGMSFKEILSLSSIILLIILAFVNVVFFILGLIIFSYILILGKVESCPRCKFYFARKLVKKDIMSTFTKYESRIQETQFKNKFGENKGSSHTTVRVPVAMGWVQNRWICKYCSHTWKGREHKEKL